MFGFTTICSASLGTAARILAIVASCGLFSVTNTVPADESTTDEKKTPGGSFQSNIINRRLEFLQLRI
jgi:hypothetical protein